VLRIFANRSDARCRYFHISATGKIIICFCIFFCFCLYTIKVKTIETLSHQNYTHRTPHRDPTFQTKGSTKKKYRLTKLIEEKYFHQNHNTFYIKHLSTSCVRITFLWYTLYFLFHIQSHIIHVVICFERILIDIIVLWKKKACIIFGKKYVFVR